MLLQKQYLVAATKLRKSIVHADHHRFILDIYWTVHNYFSFVCGTYLLAPIKYNYLLARTGTFAKLLFQNKCIVKNNWIKSLGNKTEQNIDVLLLATFTNNKNNYKNLMKIKIFGSLWKILVIKNNFMTSQFQLKRVV
jgi:hypothetical protein